MPSTQERAVFKDIQATTAIAAAALVIGGVSNANSQTIEHRPSNTNTEHTAHFAPSTGVHFITSTNVSLDLLEPFHHTHTKPQDYKPADHKPTPEQVAEKAVSHKLFVEWSKVHVCEEEQNGWHYEGSTYAGGLGISKVNWKAYGGDFFNKDESKATPVEQVAIGKKISPNPPDQSACWVGGW